MCDYSLRAFASRPAVVGETLTTYEFNPSAKGFASEGKENVAVCLLPGTEVAFDAEITSAHRGFIMAVVSREDKKHGFATAVFAKINEDNACMHHDALQFPDGTTVLVNDLTPGQRATVLQLPAERTPEKKPEKPAEEPAWQEETAPEPRERLEII